MEKVLFIIKQQLPILKYETFTNVLEDAVPKVSTGG